MEENRDWTRRLRSNFGSSLSFVNRLPAQIRTHYCIVHCTVFNFTMNDSTDFYTPPPKRLLLDGSDAAVSGNGTADTPKNSGPISKKLLRPSNQSLQPERPCIQVERKDKAEARPRSHEKVARKPAPLAVSTTGTSDHVNDVIVTTPADDGACCPLCNKCLAHMDETHRHQHVNRLLVTYFRLNFFLDWLIHDLFQYNKFSFQLLGRWWDDKKVRAGCWKVQGHNSVSDVHWATCQYSGLYIFCICSTITFVPW